ncbi:hypothetical protein FSBG_00138 [Fusobacterium gonidiaformans 3-1-5R]|uniref:Uncharacterized protein n=1 Tax=Fusobacterium gonidiaformans 3-1-5R TaxID=469605 RepID=E5BEW0_9FUSO|nr:MULTISPECIES: hypothetical protein [Fusobacterium]EFS20641.1 hypothetical protein FSBG_00138 [Fusobacterium gonidiaformans 3-1-5R]KYM58529.1 hypothetical protein A2U09_07680 [Fusobacterium necrophorum subsp. funduliforme]
METIEINGHTGGKSIKIWDDIYCLFTKNKVIELKKVVYKAHSFYIRKIAENDKTVTYQIYVDEGIEYELNVFLHEIYRNTESMFCEYFIEPVNEEIDFSEKPSLKLIVTK